MKPKFLISISVEPRNSRDRPLLLDTLATCAAVDDTLYVSSDGPASGVVLGGMSEESLAKLIGSVERSGIALNVGAPQVAYRETISRGVATAYTHKELTGGGGGQFAHVEIAVDPLERGAGFTFEQAKADAPEPFLAGARAGIDWVLVAGVVLGFPVVDLKVTLLKLVFHETDSSTEAFQIAASQAHRVALSKAGPIVLEPIMQLHVTAPIEHADAVVTDLKARRATSFERAREGAREVVAALVPLANMMGYSKALSAKSAGTATFLLAFSHYRPMPGGDDPFSTAAAKRA